MSELHQKAKDFVLCAFADDSCINGEQNKEAVLFLLQLIIWHKRGQFMAAPMDDSRRAETVRVVVK